MAKKKKISRRKEGKKERKKRPSSKKWEHYGKEGKKGRFCPKCGPGVFMAKHKNRYSCGKCGYTEFMNKDSKNSKKEEKK